MAWFDKSGGVGSLGRPPHAQRAEVRGGQCLYSYFFFVNDRSLSYNEGTILEAVGRDCRCVLIDLPLGALSGKRWLPWQRFIS